MKLIGFNGSPRKDGNTTALMGYLLREIEKEGIQTELVQLSAKAIHGCIACHRCFENQDQRCAVKNDAANEYIAMMTRAQGIVLGSPSYFQDVTAEQPSSPPILLLIGNCDTLQQPAENVGVAL